MRLLIMALAIALCLGSSAQVPFATYKRPTLAAEQNRLKTSPGDSLSIAEKNLAEANYNAELEEITQADYFDHVSANIVAMGDFQKVFPTINGEVIHYKLGLWSTRKKGTNSVTMHYLPFSLITKISSNYMDAAAGPLNDATSFSGAPLTFRFAPAFDLTPSLKYNKLFAGFNGDLRLLAIGDTVNNSIDAAWGVYTSFGLTYMGDAYAYGDNGDTDDSERHYGKWSFSTMVFWAKSGGKFNTAVFGNFQPRQLSGVEMMLRFKASNKNDSGFNFFISGSNGFTRGAPNFARWDFRIGVGS
jgi:hypothetical protein